MTRSPMITGVSDNIANRQKNSILSAYAVGKLFTGITKESLDLDTYVIPGIIRIDNSATNGPVFVTEPKGFLHVNTVNADEDTSPDQEKYIIRQVLYPDNSEFNPQTRVGHGEDIANPVSTVVWSDWAEIGSGGFLNRVELTHSMASNEFAKPNTLYYSYYNHLLRLPDPNTLKKGTRIGLEQIKNQPTALLPTHGVVMCGDKSQNTSAQYAMTYDSDGNETVTSQIIGAYLYYFTVCAKEENSNEHDWFLETDDGADDPLARVVNTRLSTHINSPNPHGQYVLKTSLSDSTTTTTNSPKVPATSYAVYKATNDLNNTLRTYIDNAVDTRVLKTYLMDVGTLYTKIRVERLPLATISEYGAVRFASANDISIGSSITVVTANYLKTVKDTLEASKRYTHIGSYPTNSMILTESQVLTSNPYLTMTTGKTITLPTPTETMVERTATVYINLLGNNSTVTVKCESLELEETFTNDKHPDTLLLVFEASYDTDNTTYTWKLVL